MLLVITKTLISKMLRMWPYVASGGILVSLLELRTVFYPTHMEECEMIALEEVSHVVQRVGPARRPARLAARLGTTTHAPCLAAI